MAAPPSHQCGLKKVIASKGGGSATHLAQYGALGMYGLKTFELTPCRRLRSFPAGATVISNWGTD